MALDGRQIYFNAVLGGIGGLVGWCGVVLVGALLPALSNVYVQDAFLGLVIGLAIGAAIGSADGLVASRSLSRLRQGMTYGAALGAVGGVIGLVLGEMFFNLLGGGVWPRALGWAIFGTLVGTGDGFARKMPARIRYGAIGGCIGGLIGGSTYDRLTVLLVGWTGDRSLALAWGGAVGLIILGACIGAMIGLVEGLLRTAWLKFLNGRLEGQSRTLDPSLAQTTLGSSDLCGIVLLGDRGVEKVHAVIATQDGAFVLRPREGKVAVDRGGPLPEASQYTLLPGDRIQIGSTRMVFQAEETSKP